jgi:hypothetical protein
MNDEMDFMAGCSEEFAELCALSSSGELSANEIELLEQHVSGCSPCRALLQEYTGLTTIGMAKLAAAYEPAAEPLPGYREKQADERFVSALRAAQHASHSRPRSNLHLAPTSKNQNGRMRLAMPLGAAACLLLCIGGGIEIGRRMEARSYQPARAVAIVNEPAIPDPVNTRLQAELKATKAFLNTITAKSVDLERNLNDLTSTKEFLSAQIDSLTRKENTNATLLSTVTQQRNELQQQLNDATTSLAQTKEELNQARQDRQGAMMRVASLETEINSLHSEFATTNRSAGNDEKFLAADRDIRELMGARQLYIADVFDVMNDGGRSKPFGRVFYTNGKSLLFYAFDLEKQPGYREAKTFQAWGKPESSSTKPISLGIFYMDSEQNRRWVVKSDNPEILAQINSVFVTVEPHGGSPKPTGKPFLEAYLHSLPPNHP